MAIVSCLFLHCQTMFSLYSEIPAGSYAGLNVCAAYTYTHTMSHTAHTYALCAHVHTHIHTLYMYIAWNFDSKNNDEF